MRGKGTMLQALRAALPRAVPLLVMGALVSALCFTAVAGERVTNGAFGSATGWKTWTERGALTRDYNSTANVPTGGASPCPRFYNSTSAFNGGIYQRILLSGGQNYTISGFSRDAHGSNGSSMWAEVLVLNTLPLDKKDYGSPLYIKYDTWACDNWNAPFSSACNTRVTTYTCSGTGVQVRYLVLKVGEGSTGKTDATFDTVGLSGTDPTLESVGALVNRGFETAWTATDGVINNPVGWFVIQWPNPAGVTGSFGYPQAYNSTEGASGRVGNYTCKFEFPSTGSGVNYFLAKEVAWGSVKRLTVRVKAFGHGWGSNGTASLGIDSDGNGMAWGDVGTNLQEATWNNDTWKDFTVSDVSKPTGASAFTIILRGTRDGNNWNCQFEDLRALGITANPTDQSVGAGAPVSFSVSTVGDGPGTLGYQWQVSTDGGTNFSNISGATANPYTFTAQSGDNGKKYRCVVTGTAVGSVTSDAATLTVTGCTPPNAPTTPGATNITTSAIRWTWVDASTDETGFKVYADAGAGPPTTLRTTTAANAQYWDYASLTANSQYAFQVASTNGTCDSAKTANYTAWTLANVPSAPTTSFVMSTTADVAITSGDGNPATTTYAILVGSQYVQTDGSLGASAVWKTAADWGAITVVGLIPNTAYAITAKARNGATTPIETSPSSPANITTGKAINLLTGDYSPVQFGGTSAPSGWSEQLSGWGSTRTFTYNDTTMPCRSGDDLKQYNIYGSMALTKALTGRTDHTYTGQLSWMGTTDSSSRWFEFLIGRGSLFNWDGPAAADVIKKYEAAFGCRTEGGTRALGTGNAADTITVVLKNGTGATGPVQNAYFDKVYLFDDGRVIGRVLSGGSPLAGATVTMVLSGQPNQTATTDSYGLWEIDGAPVADGWSVIVSKAGYVTAAYPGTKNVTGTSIVDCGDISLTADGTPPTGTVIIDGGAQYATSTASTLALSATDANGVAQMRFSNDGSAWSAWEVYGPSKSWALSTGEGTKTVYAQFMDNAQNVSPDATDTIILDTVAPSIPGTPTDAGAYTNSTSVVFNWTAATDATSGVASYNCQVGTTPGGSNVFDGNVGNLLTTTITGSNGNTYYCRVQAVDGAGNTGSWSGNSDGITVDTAPPTTTATPAGGLYNADQSVTLTADETATIYYTTDGSEPTTGSSQYSSAISITSTTTLRFFAVDSAGNAESPKKQEVYTIDKVAPTSSADPEGGLYNSDQSVVLTADETATIYYTTDGSEPTTESDPYSTPIEITSDTTLRFFAVDTAGNAEDPKNEEVYEIDKVAPTTTASPAGGTYNSDQSVTLTADETATIYYTTDGSEPTTGSDVYSSAISITSTTTLRFFAVDTAGNAEDPKQEVYTIVKNKLVLKSPSDASTIYVKAEQAFDLELWQLDLDSEVAGFQAFLGFETGMLGFDSGSYTSTPYDMHILSPIAAVGGDIDLAAGSLDTTTDDAKLAVLTFSSGTVEGTTQVVFRVFDPPTQFTILGGYPVPADTVDGPIIVVDITPPEITCPLDVSQDVVPGQCEALVTLVEPEASDALSGIASVTAVRSDGRLLTEPYPVGPTIVTWTATDLAGNQSSCDQTVWVMEYEAPVVTCPDDIVVYTGVVGAGAVVTWTASAVDNCDGVVPVTCDPASGTEFPVGTKTVTCTATDTCENVGSCSFTVTVIDQKQADIIVELEGVDIPSSFTRCITFQFGGSGGTVLPMTVSVPVDFADGIGVVTVNGIPADANWTCVTAKDPLHTLRSQTALVANGVRLAASFTGDDKLLGGDLTNDNLVDILDFGAFVGQYGTNPGADTLCDYTGRHGDISGNGWVYGEDFTFIQQKFLTKGEPLCANATLAMAVVTPMKKTGPEVDPAQPRTSVTVKELARVIGMKAAKEADLNGDSVVDLLDVEIFTQELLFGGR